MATLELTAQPAFAEVPDSSLASGAVLTAAIVAAMNENMQFGWVRTEDFWGFYSVGQTVALPVSGADGYVYSRAECVYLASIYWTSSAAAATIGTQYYPTKGPSTGPGWMQGMGQFVNQATGLVTTLVIYDSGSLPSTSTDGIVLVITIARRKRTTLTLTGYGTAGPPFVEVTPPQLDSGNVVTSGLLQAINDAANLGAVIVEDFWGYYRNGETVAAPVSTADGYVYSLDECVFFWEIYNTLPSTAALNGTQAAPTLGPASAAGQVLQVGFYVEPAAGTVSCQVSYYVAKGAQTNTTDGILMVHTLATRHSVLQSAATWEDA